MPKIPVYYYDSIPSFLTTTESERNKINEVERTMRVIVLSAFTFFVCTKVLRACSMVRRSDTMDGRNEFNIISNLRTNKKVVTECQTLETRVYKFYDEINSTLSSLNIRGVKSDDPSEVWYSMIETACDMYDPACKRLLTSMNKVFKPMIRPFDTVAFYTLMQCVYLSMIYANFASSFTQSMTAEEAKPFKRFMDFTPLMRRIMHHANLQTIDHKHIIHVFGDEEEDLRLVKTKKFYNGEPVANIHFFQCAGAFITDDLQRRGYELEQILYDLDNVRRLRAIGGLEDIDIRRLFKMRYAMCCMNTYEQYKLNIALKHGRFDQAVRIFPDFINSLPLYRGKPTKPVMCFHVDHKHIGPDGQPFVTFKGVWQSIGEASRETSMNPIPIMISRRKNDSREYIEGKMFEEQYEHVWLSPERFLAKLLHDVAPSVTASS